MKHLRLSAVLLLPLLLATPALSKEASLKVMVDGMRADGTIAEANALCKPTADGKSEPGANTRPTISWSGAPADTKSYAIVVVDPDVPADFSDAGKEGKVVRGDAKRQQFFHWALVDIPASTTNIAGGDAAKAPDSGRQIPADLKGYVPKPEQFGGPCPPWNDERVHHYHFMVMALDVASLKLPENATAKEVLSASASHVLARGEQVGTYTLNPLLLKK